MDIGTLYTTGLQGINYKNVMNRMNIGFSREDLRQILIAECADLSVDFRPAQKVFQMAQEENCIVVGASSYSSTVTVLHKLWKQLNRLRLPRQYYPQ